MENKHKPVLLKQIIDFLEPYTSGNYVDATLGGGGHSKAILAKLDQNSKLISYDVDKAACLTFQKYIDSNNLSDRSIVINSNYSEIKNLEQENIVAIMADLGVSTNQYDTVPGLSFQNDQILDMRMDSNLKVTASDLLNGLYKNELLNIFYKFADISFARKLVDEILKLRTKEKIIKTSQLNKIIRKIVPIYLRKGNNKHPEAKVYQALRIAVNRELDSLNDFLISAFDKLCQGGKLAIITFHSGEDRIVKNFFNNLEKENKAILPEKFIKPTEEEVLENNNSRSAKLRILIKK